MGTNVTAATINNRVKKRLQISFRRLMLGVSPSAEMMEYTGMDSYQLKQYITSMMLIPEMNWNNYGEIWNVEHLVSLCYFDLSKKEDRKLAWHPLNLIPILEKDMRLKEGNLSFSLKLLEGKPQSDARDKLIDKVRNELKVWDEYIEYYHKGKYYKPNE